MNFILEKYFNNFVQFVHFAFLNWVYVFLTNWKHLIWFFSGGVFLTLWKNLMALSDVNKALGRFFIKRLLLIPSFW